mmetsp:Transcript_144440/g.204292  ORF Transcript_144440/g.204292 Transcript_144440/m.204292 type:complete len:253 (+) Transcript_144440:622-1380(+)
MLEIGSQVRDLAGHLLPLVLLVVDGILILLTLLLLAFQLGKGMFMLGLLLLGFANELLLPGDLPLCNLKANLRSEPPGLDGALCVLQQLPIGFLACRPHVCDAPLRFAFAAVGLLLCDLPSLTSCVQLLLCPGMSIFRDSLPDVKQFVVEVIAATLGQELLALVPFRLEQLYRLSHLRGGSPTKIFDLAFLVHEVLFVGLQGKESILGLRGFLGDARRLLLHLRLALFQVVDRLVRLGKASAGPEVLADGLG